MESNDFKIKVSKIPDQTWVNAVSYSFPFDNIEYRASYNGISSIYEFINQQVHGWSDLVDDLPKELQESKDFFGNCKRDLERFVAQIMNNSNVNVGNEWRSLLSSSRSFRPQGKTVFPYDAPETVFLIDIYHNFKESYYGAFKYLTKNVQFTSREEFTGAIMAYEFIHKDKSEITKRRTAEKASISKLRNDFQSYISDSEAVLISHLNKSKEELDKYINQFEELRTSKEAQFEVWFQDTQNGFQDFDSNAKQEMQDLESVFQEKLRLEKPAKYWSERAKKLKSEAKWSIWIMVGLIIAAAGSLFCLLWLTPEGVFLNFIKDPVQSIKWSLIFITFLSFIAFGIKVLSKISFSSFHLARDAEEREQLAYVYLALLKDNDVTDSDRNLILQSLFSRADTGLLKDDSSPTMPSGLVRKFLENN